MTPVGRVITRQVLAARRRLLLGLLEDLPSDERACFARPTERLLAQVPDSRSTPGGRAAPVSMIVPWIGLPGRQRSLRRRGVKMAAAAWVLVSVSAGTLAQAVTGIGLVLVCGPVLLSMVERVPQTACDSP